MNRREFVFRSLKAAALLSPVLSLREARAATTPKRVIFWVACSGYPTAADFFPSGSETAFALPPLLSGLADVKQDLVIVDGIDLRDSGPNPKGNNHIRTPGKVLTAKDVIDHPSDPLDGLPGGISIDQLIARERRLVSYEAQVHTKAYNHMRARPFATGARQFKPPIVEPELAWDKLFKGVQPSGGDGAAAEAARLARLASRQSLLDDLTDELVRFRGELDGMERLKLDVHEDAIRRAEESVAADLEQRAELPTTCDVPERLVTGTLIPKRSAAHFDLMFAGLACDRFQVGSMIFGYSGYAWRYEWVPQVVTGNIHDEVHHRAAAARDAYLRSAAWDWSQLGAFLKRLKAMPEGTGTMLDNTLVVAVSHFGLHHRMNRIPVVLAGAAGGRLRTNRYLKLAATTYNDKLLTSVARLMDVDIAGIGDDPQCGPLGVL